MRLSRLVTGIVAGCAAVLMSAFGGSVLAGPPGGGPRRKGVYCLRMVIWPWSKGPLQVVEPV